MVHRAVIGDDGLGPVAEASTREQCIALYPGSNPGRASTLRPDGLRVALPRKTVRAKRVRRSPKGEDGPRLHDSLMSEAAKMLVGRAVKALSQLRNLV